VFSIKKNIHNIITFVDVVKLQVPSYFFLFGDQVPTTNKSSKFNNARKTETCLVNIQVTSTPHICSPCHQCFDFCMNQFVR
jgi:hypothetical protein